MNPYLESYDDALHARWHRQPGMPGHTATPSQRQRYDGWQAGMKERVRTDIRRLCARYHPKRPTSAKRPSVTRSQQRELI